MKIEELVSGRLYKLKNKLQSSDYECNEDLAMFLRITSGKASVLTIRGEYKIVGVNELVRPEMEYLDLFNKEDVENFTKIMKSFFAEYQKYDSIKYGKSGFKSGKIRLTKLNTYKKELESLKILPKISIVVDNYFETYKDMGLEFEALEDLMLDFAYIPEWEKNFDDLRGFDFKNNKIPPKKMKKYTKEALMLHHMYTNLFIYPNFNNIKTEWLDMLADRVKNSSTSTMSSDKIISVLNSIKWKCVLENTISESKKK